MTGYSEWPIIPPKKVKLESPVSAMKARMDAVYEARISPRHSASQAFDIGWEEGFYAGFSDMEEQFWKIVDREGPSGLPSDMLESLELLSRARLRLIEAEEEKYKAMRNRDMWRGQSERQANVIDELRTALHEAINAPKGVVPASADPFYNPNYAAKLDDLPGFQEQQP